MLFAALYLTASSNVWSGSATANDIKHSLTLPVSF